MRRRKLLADTLQVPSDALVGDLLGPNDELIASAEEMEITLPAELVADLYLFDTLPRPIRWALHQAIRVWKAQQFADFFQPYWGDRLRMAEAIHHALLAIAEEQHREQMEFAAIHRKRWGYPLPHVAARATVQTYGPRQI